MSKLPLWKAMDDGLEVQASKETEIDGLMWKRIRAAEIRALRDWLLPEEEPPLGPAGKAHMELRALLSAEADRAEKGDV